MKVSVWGVALRYFVIWLLPYDNISFLFLDIFKNRLVEDTVIILIIGTLVVLLTIYLPKFVTIYLPNFMINLPKSLYTRALTYCSKDPRIVKVLGKPIYIVEQKNSITRT